LDEIRTKVSRVFLLAIHRYLHSFALRFFFFNITQPLTVSVHCKGKRRKAIPLPYGLRNPDINLKSENSQDYAPKPQRN
jgi:hypothetical protein